MQTIARANRVSEGKSNGLILDYIGIVKALRKALADYTANVGGQGGTDPTVDKIELIKRILETISTAKAFLKEKEFELDDLIKAKDFEKVSCLQTAANAVCGCIEDKKAFQTYASELIRLMKYTDRNDIDDKTRKEYDAISAIYSELQKKRKKADNTDLMVEINNIISEYVDIDDVIGESDVSKQFDISSIDFELLHREFSKSRKKNLVMKDLQEVIEGKLAALLFTNPNRINYYERYQEIINEYNSEQDRANIEKTFTDLMNLAHNLSEEEQRYVREGFSNDEELSMFDLLMSDSISKADIKAIKSVAVSLLNKIKQKIAELDHWTDKQETKAVIDTLIRNTLWNELPESYDEIKISSCRERVYEYVYTRYRIIA